jgi:TatD DNase family protein
MPITDTHIHLYSEKFGTQAPELIQTAMEKGVNRFLLPNVDLDTLDPMFGLCAAFPGVCFPMVGLHPCHVFADYIDVLTSLEKVFHERKNELVAVGEIGVDLYWDKTFRTQQEEAFKIQCRWAVASGLPVVIHSRESTDVILGLLDDLAVEGCKPVGVFHCFSGTVEQAKQCIDKGFMLGIGGVVTYKNSGLQPVLDAIGLEHILLETDAPYLAPVPHRGKRNDPQYIVHVADKVAEITGRTVAEVASVTSANADRLFQLKQHVNG